MGEPLRFIGSILLLLVTAFFTNAQELQHINYTVGHGMPSAEAYCVIQDHDRYIWIGTDHGLARFDGKEFRTMTTADGLLDNTVLKMNLDKQGRMWLATFDTMLNYLENDKIEAYKYILQSQAPLNYKPPSMIVDKQGKKWLEIFNGADIYEEIAPDTFGSILDKIQREQWPDCRIAVKTFSGTSAAHCHVKYVKTSLQPEVKVYKDYYLINGPFPVTSCFFYPLADGSIVGLWNSGEVLHFKGEEVLYYGKLSTEASFFVHLYQDRDQHLWLCFSDGLLFFDQPNFTQSGRHFFKGQFITRVIQDVEGSYWLTDRDNGLIFVPSLNFKVNLLPRAIDNKRLSVFKHRFGQLYLSTVEGKIFKINETGAPEFLCQSSIGTTDVYDFEVDKRGRIHLPDMAIYAPKHKHLDRSNTVTRSYKSVYLKNDTIWGGHSFGFHKRKVASGKDWHSTQLNFFNRTNALMVDDDHSLWIGCIAGLYKMKNEKITRLYGDSILNARITTINSGAQNTTVIGTRGGGMVVIRADTVVRSFTTKQGLLSNMVRSVYVSGETIYAGTNKGLSLIRNYLGSASVESFHSSNGLPSNDIRSVAGAYGKIWLATDKGIVSFNPNKVHPNQVAPVVHMEEVISGNQTFDPTQEITLEAHQRNLIFAYNGLCYRAGDKVRYKYFMEGYDQDTLYTREQTTQYTNLPPGVHAFNVWVCNEDGYWSEQPAKVSFIIPPFFTETLTFKMLMILLVLTLVALGFYLMYRRNNEKLQVALQTTELRQQALAAMMNPHFIYNALSSIQHYINTNERKKANLYLSQFAKLSRYNLQAVKDGASTLEEELERLKLYLDLEQMRFKGKLEYRIEVDPSLTVEDIMIPAMVIQPFVENAIWHGLLPLKQSGKVDIQFQAVDQHTVKVVIRDNGIGLSAAQEKKPHHTSLSMKITQERLDLLTSTTQRPHTIQIAELSQEEGGGTQVSIVLPV